ncbi:MAG: putative DNA binding domain-containing protein [Candidatus Competibacteraceae bacterium]|nr:putative DNA binding domain-containing protein [Candidatus Competibacteraceae bacterium]
MNETELLKTLARGEDSRHQFKENISNVDSLAAELVAFSNSGGGTLIVGVNDAGEVLGLTTADIGRLNQLLSNAASQSVRPPIHPISLNVQTARGLLMVIQTPDGLNRPYTDNQGRIWVKSGADKRHVTAREEMQRLFQQAGLIYADEIPVTGTTVVDIDHRALEEYFESRYREPLEETDQSLERLLRNMGLVRDGALTLAGLLLFAKKPERFRPAFMIKAVALPGRELHETRYLDSEDIFDHLAGQYQRGLAFIKRNLHYVQGDQGINSLGILEIPEIALQELLVNALIHRDYFISAPIRLLVFADRVEIDNPGHLPNHLNIEQIRYGLSNMRNPLLASHATHLLPYRGLGSGIPRALKAWPNIELVDDRAGNQFKAIIRRPAGD